MPEIIFLMGKSATGKDHIYEQLAHDEQLHLKRITMYTTRPMRAGEAEGVEYHFVNDDEAARLEKEGKIIEMRCYDTVIGVWKYFTVNDGHYSPAWPPPSTRFSTVSYPPSAGPPASAPSNKLR